MAEHYFTIVLILTFQAAVFLGQSTSLTSATDACTSDAWGQEFFVGIIGYQKQSPDWVQGTRFTINLNVFAKRRGQIVLSSPGTNFTKSTFDVRKGLISLNLPEYLIHLESPLNHNKGIRITSNVNISVTLTVTAYKMSESALILPTSLLSTEYIVSYSEAMKILLVGVEDNTDYNVTYSNDLNSTRGFFHRFDTVLLDNAISYDIAAAIISSNKPIAVFSGRSLKSGSIVFEQAIPIVSWGFQYIVPQLPYAHSFRLYAAQDGTAVHVNNSITEKIARGQIRQSTVYAGALPLTSNRPVMVELYGSGYNGLLVSLPAISQFSNEYSFFVSDEGLNQYVTVIVKTSDKDGFIFNELTIPEWIKESDVNLNGIKYHVASYQVFRPGYHHITHTSPMARFGGIVSGTANDRSYAHSLGFVMGTDREGCASQSAKTLSVKRSSSHSPKSRGSSNLVVLLVLLFLDGCLC